MADVDIKYKGSSIASMNASGIRTLNTSGKYCEGDIIVEYTDPEKPTQSKTVTPTASGFTVTPDNGKVLSSVVINGDADLVASNIRNGVNIFGVTGNLIPGITPSGTKDITENGNGIDVTQYAAVNVNVPSGAANTKRFEVTLASDVTTGYQTFVSGDADVLAHRTSAETMVMFCYLGNNGDIPEKSCLFSVKGNMALATGYYGTSLRKYNAGTVYSGNFGYNLATMADTSGDIYINAEGDLKMCGAGTYTLKAGKYIIVLMWW